MKKVIIVLSMIASQTAFAQVALQPRYPLASDPGYERALKEIEQDRSWKIACARPMSDECYRSLESYRIEHSKEKQ